MLPSVVQTMSIKIRRATGSHVLAAAMTLILAAPSAVRSQTVVYVDRDADQLPHDGSDWCHAYLEVYEALGSAGPDTVIRVADGVYLPDPSGWDDPRDATFQLANGVALAGGYAGCDADDPDERDVTVYVTILSGDIGTLGDNTDNCYHVVVGSGTDATAVLDGFTITGGNATQLHTRSDGGGMYIDRGDPTVVNCVFTGNSAGNYGGGMYLGQASPTLAECVFTDNVGRWGGAVLTWFGAPTMICCRFNENSSDRGGGITVDGGNPRLANCTFTGNTAARAGGGMWNYTGNSMLANCTFSGNSADSGGAISNTATTTLANCVFAGNWAAYGVGGIYSDRYYGHATLVGCIVCSNHQVQIDGPASVTYSCIEGGWEGEGNIDADPLFVRNPDDGGDGWGDDPNTPGIDEGANDDFGDLRLTAESPCVDAGSNIGVLLDELDLDGDGDTAERLPLDLDGILRFSDRPGTDDTGVADPPDYPLVVDMGAYEHGTFADLDGDCVVGLSDLAQLLGSYRVASGMSYADGDLDGDGDVDLADLAALLSVYRTACP